MAVEASTSLEPWASTSSGPRRLGHPVPRFGTARDERYPTKGADLAKVAKLLGRPLLPWQRHVADIALEFDPSRSRWRYSEVNVIVPRQSGKTDLVHANNVRTALYLPGAMCVYTAQDRNKALARLKRRFAPQLNPKGGPFTPPLAAQADLGQLLEFFRKHSPVAEQVAKVSEQNGQEGIYFRNGSWFGIDAVKDDSGHGETLDTGTADEAMKHRTDAVEAAMLPSMTTRPWAQFWVTSAAGTWESDYLNEKMKRGQALIESGEPSTIAYFEYSAPLDADPDSEDTWYECIPSLEVPLPGRPPLIEVETVRARREQMSDSEFRRAYLTQPKKEQRGLSPFASRDWKRSYEEGAAVDPHRRLVVGVDVRQDRSRSAISFGSRREGKRYVSELVRHEDGADWVPEWLIERDGQYRFAYVVMDGRGQTRSFERELQRHFGDRLLVMGPRDMATACGWLYDDVIHAYGAHRGQPALDAAVDGARKRPLAGAWAIDAADATTDISPLISRVAVRHGLEEVTAAEATNVDPLSQIL